MQVENLAAYRYEMMEKGYMNKSELSKFLGCGRNKGSKIFQKIMEDIKKEGLENIDSNIILTKRAVQYLGLTQKNIVESYERSIKKKARRPRSKTNKALAIEHAYIIQHVFKNTRRKKKMITIKKEKPAKEELKLFSVEIVLTPDTKDHMQMESRIQGHKSEMKAFLETLDVNPEEYRNITTHAAKAMLRDFVQQVVNLSESLEGAEMEETED